MAFTRTKRITKNGKTYTYQYQQHSVRIGKKVKSIHLGKASVDAHVSAFDEDKHNDAFNAKHPTAFAKAIENAPSKGEGKTATPAAEAEPSSTSGATSGEASSS